MYLPPLDAMLKAVGATREQLNSGADVTIPAELLKLLIQAALASSDFNEAGYLSANPDVAAGVRAGAVPNARAHFIGFGYFEGRQGATPEVDERWYLRSYPDVGSAVRAGKLSSATEHFMVVGASEGRSPNVRYEGDAAQWKSALQAA